MALIYILIYYKFSVKNTEYQIKPFADFLENETKVNIMGYMGKIKNKILSQNILIYRF